MRPLSLMISLAHAFLVVSSGCKDKLPTQRDYLSIVLPDSNISYSKHIEPLFMAACVSCHGGSYAPDLTTPSWSNLMNYQPQLVVSGKGSSSLLVQILNGSTPPIMPPSGAHLTTNQINGIKRWIDEGAYDN